MVDTWDMLDFERQELMDDLDWQAVLTAYRDRRDAAKAADPEFDGWLERVVSVEPLDAGRLPRLHGKLLALGFLKFQLAGRSEGVRYQITSDGVRALDGFTTEPSDSDADIDADSDDQACEISGAVLKFAGAASRS